jgi:UDP:flavonoid glycosyltransferase YjiC (YdhE family)
LLELPAAPYLERYAELDGTHLPWLSLDHHEKLVSSLKTNVRRSPVILAVEMGYAGHLRRMVPILRGLVEAGAHVHLLSSLASREVVQPLGVQHHDLFADGTADQSDEDTWPRSLRGLAFAADHGEAILQRAAALTPNLILFDSFAFLGEAMARRFGIPSVSLISGHNRPPASSAESLRQTGVQHLSPRALESMVVLRDRYGLHVEVPTDLWSIQSPWLNLYGEPPEFLPADAREPFHPIAFFGSLQPERVPDPTPVFSQDAAIRHRMFVALGSINWRYFSTSLHGTLRAVSEAVASMPDAEAIVSLCGEDASAVPGVAGERVRVASYVDQWSVLAQATTLITHHGLNSTHEAIWHQVPMLSVPFFHDQPGLARRCQAFGLALPLSEPRIRVPTVAEVRAAMEQALVQRPAMLESLAEAKVWEQRVINQRPAVIGRILDLI